MPSSKTSRPSNLLGLSCRIEMRREDSERAACVRCMFGHIGVRERERERERERFYIYSTYTCIIELHVHVHVIYVYSQVGPGARHLRRRSISRVR